MAEAVLLLVALFAIGMAAIPLLSWAVACVRPGTHWHSATNYVIAWGAVAAVIIVFGAFSGEPISIIFWGGLATLGAVAAQALKFFFGSRPRGDAHG